MGYYIRLFSQASAFPTLVSLRKRVKQLSIQADIRLEEGTGKSWKQILVCSKTGKEFFSVERNSVKKGSLGAEELAEFLELNRHAKPRSSAEWLDAFLPKTKTIYAIQFLNVNSRNRPILNEIQFAVRALGPAIIQADNEGFSNEDGFHITWEFFNSAAGTWWMGLLKKKKWIHFQIDLANPKHRSAFKRGVVPAGVKFWGNG